MTKINLPQCRRIAGSVLLNESVSAGLIRLDIKLTESFLFLPGQFAMLNVTTPAPFVFSRPFSILSAKDDVVSFLYRVVGRGTEVMAGLHQGASVTVLGPLGGAFPAETDGPVVLVAGGVGLPPLIAWWHKYGREQDLAFFGGRDGADVPWELFDTRWNVSVDNLVDIPEGKTARPGLVTELLVDKIDLTAAGPGMLLSCGPLPLLRAVADLAQAANWSCYISMEEKMGCGYGACKGCVIPVFADLSDDNSVSQPDKIIRNATCCQDGPVFCAEDVNWKGLA